MSLKNGLFTEQNNGNFTTGSHKNSFPITENQHQGETNPCVPKEKLNKFIIHLTMNGMDKSLC